MGTSLRRSRRSAPTKKTSSYSVGDIVEIVRGSLVLKGRLAYLLSEGQTPNPRWLVTFDDDQKHKDEELYEKAFGKLIKSSASSVDEDDAPSEDGKAVPFSKDNNPAQSDNDSSSQGKQDRTSNNSNSNSNENNSNNADVSASARAREQRSRRRQAKVVDELPVAVSTVVHNKGGNKRRSITKNNVGGNKRTKLSENDNKGGEDTEEVVKVKLLTGTLYLYRGLHRRAEFVRRV